MKNGLKKIVSASLAMAIAAGVTTPALVANAGDTYPYLGESAKGENQPYQHGYRAEDLLSWSPETDPYAELLRAQIPLQERNEAFADTQANPALSSQTENFTLAGDYGNAFFDSYPYTNEFSQHVFNFWQYTDYYGSWHGMPTEEVPESMYNAEGERNGTSSWTQRNFEFGMMNLPNPGYTNAAHKNGVLSLGCIFQPRAYQHFEALLTQDENGRFVCADKLVEICEYYGFDGWFFNMEGRSISSENQKLLQDFFAQMREDGLYIQWYTANGSFSSNTASYLTSATPDNTENAVRRAESVFLDYGWPYSVDSSLETAKSFGLDPLKAVFGGMEAGRDRWSNDFDKFLDGDGNMRLSIGTLGTEFVHDGLDEDLGTGTKIYREKDEYQWMTFERERLWWTGANNQEGPNAGLSGEDIGTSKTDFKGISNYISERSVIHGDTFVTNFNTGHGLEYAESGEVSSEKEWSNISLQDILPTWQWWFDTEGTKLNAEFDYGTQYKRNQKDGSESSFAFDLVGAYNGGSSLAIYGELDAKNFMHLYKTDLEVKENSKMEITFQKTSNDAAAMKLGVIFENDPNTVVELDIDNSAAKSDGWVTSEINLSAYAGEKIAAFGLVFDGDSADYQMNIGQIKYTSNEVQKPEAPTGLTIEKAYDTGEMVVSWEKAPYEDVKQYNVYKIEDGKEIFLGGTYDEIFYIKNIYGTDKPVTIALKAVTQDGTQSDAATVDYDYSKAVKDIEVKAEDGKLNVTWTGGQADVTVTTSCEEDARTWTASGDGSAVVEVPTGEEADGARYTMTIATEDGTAATYDGRLDDSWSDPYDGSMKNMAWTSPTSKDWYRIRYWVNHSEYESGYYFRGRGGDNAYFKDLPSDTTYLEVVLEDYNGNKSEPVAYYFKNGQPVDMEQDEIGEDEFPDPVLLEAVKEKVGSTFGEVLQYTGELDLSGLEITDLTGMDLIYGVTSMDISGTKVTDLSPLAGMNSLKELNASNTQVEEVLAGELPASLETLDLSANGKLLKIQEGVVSQLENLKTLHIQDDAALEVLYLDNAGISSIDLSGCTAIKELCVTGSKIQELDISDCTGLTRLDAKDSSLEKIVTASGDAYTDIYRFDLSGSKLDLSEGTPERQWIDELEAYVEANPITPVEAEAANIALEGTVTSDVTGSFPPSYLIDGDDYSYFGSFLEGQSAVVDLGSVQTVTSWKIYFYNTYYLVPDFHLEVSEDGQTYRTVDTVTDNAEEIFSKELQTSVRGRYFKFVVDKKGQYDNYIREFQLFGEPIEPYGVVYGNQRPVAYTNLPEKVTVTTSQIGSIRTKDYFEDSYKNAETVRGMLFSSLEGADWIAPDYDIAAQIAVPENVSVEITDEAGTVINPSDTPDYEGVLKLDQTGLYTVNFMKDGGILDTMQVRVKAVTSVLERVIEKAEQMKADGALDNTMEAVVTEFNAALEEAKALVAREDATQAELKDSAVRLLAVMAKVDWKQGDKTILEVAVDVALSINENLDLYEEAGKQEFIDALATAQELLASGNAWQDDIDAATDALIEAMSNLRMKPNKDILNDMINQASGLDLSLYTSDSAAALNAALANAKAVAADDNATQAQIDTAADTLKAAMSGLVFVDGTTGTTTPAGEGTIPTKTGDAGAAGLAALALLSAGALIVLKKRNRG